MLTQGVIFQELSNYDGDFSIIFDTGYCYYLISDCVASYPLFYNEDIIVEELTKDMEKNYGLDQVSLSYFKINKLCVPMTHTLLKNVNRIEIVEIVRIQGGRITKEKYIKNILSVPHVNFDFKEYLNFVIKHKNPDYTLLPLTGGIDSRYILHNSSKENKEKTIAYTIGKRIS